MRQSVSSEAAETANEDLMRKIGRLETCCWRSGQTDAARVLAALTIAVQAADGERAEEKAYLGELVKACEEAQSALFKALFSAGAWNDFVPAEARYPGDELALRRLRKSTPAGDAS